MVSQQDGHEKDLGRGRVGQGGSACRAPRAGLSQEGAGHSRPPSRCLEKVMLGEGPGFSTQMLRFSEGRNRSPGHMSEVHSHPICLVPEAPPGHVGTHGGEEVQEGARSTLSSSHGNETLKTPGLGINMF